MSALMLAQAAVQAVVLFGVLAIAGALFCRERWLGGRSVRHGGPTRAYAIGIAALGAFLLPLLYHVGWEGAAADDAYLGPAAQGRLVGALCLASLALHFWGWRCDRRRGGLLTLLVQTGVYSSLWVAGLRVQGVALAMPALLTPEGEARPVVALAPWASLAITLLWLTLMSSVVEYLDGVEGLAAGVVAAAAVGVLVHATVWSGGDHFVQLVATLLAATAAAAAWWGRPAGRLLAGKSGTLPLGLWLGVLTILARQKSAAAGVLLPLAAGVVLAAAVMLGFVERSLSIGRGRRASAPTKE